MKAFWLKSHYVKWPHPFLRSPTKLLCCETLWSPNRYVPGVSYLSKLLALWWFLFSVLFFYFVCLFLTASVEWAEHSLHVGNWLIVKPSLRPAEDVYFEWTILESTPWLSAQDMHTYQISICCSQIHRADIPPIICPFRGGMGVYC